MYVQARQQIQTWLQQLKAEFESLAYERLDELRLASRDRGGVLERRLPLARYELCATIMISRAGFLDKRISVEITVGLCAMRSSRSLGSCYFERHRDGRLHAREGGVSEAIRYLAGFYSVLGAVLIIVGSVLAVLLLVLLQH